MNTHQGYKHNEIVEVTNDTGKVFVDQIQEFEEDVNDQFVWVAGYMYRFDQIKRASKDQTITFIIKNTRNEKTLGFYRRYFKKGTLQYNLVHCINNP